MKVILTEEMKEKMRGFAPFNANEKYSFVLDTMAAVDVPTKFFPKFTIKTLDKGSHIAVCKLFLKPEEANSDEIFEFARKVTVGWGNLIDIATCECIEFKADPDGGCDAETFGKLPRYIPGRILNRAREISGLFGGEKMGLG